MCLTHQCNCLHNLRQCRCNILCDPHIHIISIPAAFVLKHECVDRNRDWVGSRVGAMAETGAEGAAGEKVIVRRFVGRCPVGGCTKAGCDLGKGYEDGGAEARRKVFCHLRYSPQHEGSFGTDDEVSDLLDTDDSWLLETKQEWTQDEFDQFVTENPDAMEAQDDEAAGKGVPEPAEGPSKGKGKPRSKSKASSGSYGRRPPWQPRSQGHEPGLERRLEAQIKRQTMNMLHFTKAASSCIAALNVAADMSRQAANTFEQQRAAMEEGMEEMVAAFGLEPEQRRRSYRRQLDVSDERLQIDLARNVRRGAPY